MELRGLVEPHFFTRPRMRDDALEGVFQLQTTIRFPFVIDQHIAAVRFHCRLVCCLKGCLPRQSEAIATVEISHILHPPGPEVVHNTRIQFFKDPAIVSEWSFTALSRFYDAAKEKASWKLVGVSIFTMH